MKRAIIEAGVVVNIIEADADFAPDGVTLVDATADTRIGGGWDGAVFSPPPVVPEPVRIDSPVVVAIKRLAAAAGADISDLDL